MNWFLSPLFQQMRQICSPGRSFNDVVSFLERDKKLVLFGAGEQGGATLDLLKRNGIAVHYFIDNSPQKTGTFIDDIPVFSVAEIEKIADEVEILLTSSYYSEHLKQLFDTPLFETLRGTVIPEYYSRANNAALRCHLLAMRMHPEAFGKYCGMFREKEAVICGAGPTLNSYTPVSGAVHIGVNRAFLYDKVKFDILFNADYRGIKSVFTQFAEYEAETCVKFIQCTGLSSGESLMPEYKRKKIKNCREFIANAASGNITTRIDILPLYLCNSTAIYAMQFALWTQPKRIYLAGCDCTNHIPGSFFTSMNEDEVAGREPQKWDRTAENSQKMILQWHKIKEFADYNYPDTEIVSINPVGLKGLFKDIYT